MKTINNFDAVGLMGVCSTSELRKNLTLPYYLEDGRLVATDGMSLYMAECTFSRPNDAHRRHVTGLPKKTRVTNSSKIVPSCKVVYEDRGQYPNIDAVIPEEAAYDHSIEVKPSRWRGLKELKSSTFVVNIDRSNGHISIGPAWDEMYDKKPHVIAVCVTRYLDALSFVGGVDAEEVLVHTTKDQLKPVKITSKDGQRTAIVMPMAIAARA